MNASTNRRFIIVYTHTNVEFIINRDLTPTECDWLNYTVVAGSKVFLFTGATYGCIGNGHAVSFKPNNEGPFFEVPFDAIDPQVKP